MSKVTRGVGAVLEQRGLEWIEISSAPKENALLGPSWAEEQ